MVASLARSGFPAVERSPRGQHRQMSHVGDFQPASPSTRIWAARSRSHRREPRDDVLTPNVLEIAKPSGLSQCTKRPQLGRMTAILRVGFSPTGVEARLIPALASLHKSASVTPRPAYPHRELPFERSLSHTAREAVLLARHHRAIAPSRGTYSPDSPHAAFPRRSPPPRLLVQSRQPTAREPGPPRLDQPSRGRRLHEMPELDPFEPLVDLPCRRHRQAMDSLAGPLRRTQGLAKPRGPKPRLTLPKHAPPLLFQTLRLSPLLDERAHQALLPGRQASPRRARTEPIYYESSRVSGSISTLVTRNWASPARPTRAHQWSS